jgi:hypothetical protein
MLDTKPALYYIIANKQSTNISITRFLAEYSAGEGGEKGESNDGTKL